MNRKPVPFCELCQRRHQAESPHDATSLAFQAAFHREHGRVPTWEDAMAHLDESLKDFYRNALRELYDVDPRAPAEMTWSSRAS